MRRRLRRRALRLAFHVLGACVVGSVLLVLPWRWLPPPTTAFMLESQQLRGSAPVHHWVPRARISSNLARCVVAAEDQKFPSHHGFDVQSMWHAVQQHPRKPRGASTLSQQVAKNLYLWPGRSLLRKGLEAWLTGWIELLWPKGRILEVYLNVAEFSPGVFGAEAASRRAFQMPADRLSLHQAALLTAVLPSPRRMSAARPSDYVQQRAREIESEARRLGPGHLAGI